MVRLCFAHALQGREKKTGMKDRRKFPRYAKQLYLILYIDDDTASKAMTIDISCGGFRLQSTRELKPGTIIAFRSQDALSSHAISGTGEVMWCNPSEDGDSYEFGVAFPTPIQFTA